MILLILCVFAVVALVDLRPIVRHHERRDLIIYLAVLTVPLLLAVLMVSGVKIPSTQTTLGNLFERIFGKIYPS